ncbi:MFS general substrate transporter [Xylariaceae sp. FL0016]|nr:MFS general substrate transporter [Xylariaceae sp. FL0016]
MEKDSPSNGVIPASDATPNDHGEAEVYSAFSRGTRHYLTILLGVIMILSSMTATIYFPLIPSLSRSFSVSIQQINLTVTVYAIFQAAAPGFFASLADLTGRRPVLLGLIALYMIGSLGLVLNRRDSYAILITMRALQSIGGSPTTALAYGVAADVSTLEQRGGMVGPMMSICNGISAGGPVIGGGVSMVPGGHVWVFLTLLLISVLLLFVTGLTLPETSRLIAGNGSKPTHGIWRTWAQWCTDRRARHSDDAVGAETERQGGEKRTKWEPLSAFTSLRIIFYPDAFPVLWTIASSYCIYYTYQVAIPTIFDEIYGYNELFIGLSFLPGLVGMTIGGIVAGRLMDRNFAKVAASNHVELGGRTKLAGNEIGDFPIEAARYRFFIPIIVVESLLVAGYGWAVAFRVHAAVPLVLQFFACALSTLMSHTASALLVETFPDRSSSAYAAGQAMRCGLSAASAAVLQPLVDAVGRGWFFVMFAVFLGTTAVASVSVSLTLGKNWRKKRLEGKNQDI